MKNSLYAKNCGVFCHKPRVQIEKLIEHMLPFAQRCIISRRQRLLLTKDGERYCFLLNSGSVALYRGGDGMILNSESAPYVFGISSQLFPAENLYFCAQEESEVSMLPLEMASRIITHQDLWEYLANLLIYNSARIYEHCAQISSLSSYEIIRAQLYELINEPEEVRMKVSVVSYIMGRTFLSRSSIMKILSQLRMGEYITMHRGMLVGINNIPMKY